MKTACAWMVGALVLGMVSCAGAQVPAATGSAVVSGTATGTIAPQGAAVAAGAESVEESPFVEESIEVPEIIDKHLAHREIWGYLVLKEESAWRPTMPISDLAYFAGEIDNKGFLKPVPPRSSLKNAENIRVHLVLPEVGNYARAHFVLNPNLPYRQRLLDDLVKASEGYDGVQLDFETVLTEDGPHYLSFLKELKKRVGKKIVSVALPARTGPTKEYFKYEDYAAVVDRIIVMAYDEHWSGSKPGSVASFLWCRRVATYTRKVIPAEKLVMGLPFYGRIWADRSLGRAVRHSTVSKILGEKEVITPVRRDEVPYFEYQEQVKFQVYFEDAWSTLARVSIYGQTGVDKIAFWRVGQEDPKVWGRLRLITGGSSASAPASKSPPAP